MSVVTAAFRVARVVSIIINVLGYRAVKGLSMFLI